VVASALPWILSNWLGVPAGTPGAIPLTVKLSFYVGAAAFLGAVLWTVLTTGEHPPEDIEDFRASRAAGAGLRAGAREIAACIASMPAVMRRLAWVQICSWFGLFCMWLYFPVAVAREIFGASDEASPLYRAGVEWGGLCFAAYSAVCFVFSFALPAIARRIGRRATHSACLACGAAGLLSAALVHDKHLLFVCMIGVGVAWASILSMPYALLAGSLPPRQTGVYMGIFNFFIVLPEIAASLGFGWVMLNLLDNDRMAAVVAGGAFLALAAVLVRFVPETPVRSREMGVPMTDGA
jgi:maltose/moltooligosaccharide transporter